TSTTVASTSTTVASTSTTVASTSTTVASTSTTVASTSTTVATTSTTVATTSTTVATTTTTTTIPGCCGFPGAGPTKLRFESVTGSGSVPGSQFHVGTGNITLTKGGLFFGGSGETVPLPSVVPDKGVSFLGTTCSGTTLTAGPM